MQTTLHDYENILNDHTPSFQPPIGINPITVTVTAQMIKVARRPRIQFIVAKMRIGHAMQIPVTMPIRAFHAKV
jgi:hypothetical protein